MQMDCEEECILQSVSQKSETKPEESYKFFESHIHPASKFRVTRHHFSQLQQDKF